MKKYFLLISGLVLAACGGGGGGGAGTPGLPVRAAVDPSALSVNNTVTSMASEVLIPTSSGDSVVTRAASVNYDGKNYISYRLDEVDFRVATGGGNDASLKFTMDDLGKIDSLVMNVGGDEQHLFRRSDETADFRGIVYEYVLLEEGADPEADYSKAADRDTKVRLVFSEANDPTDFSVLSNAAAGKCPAGRQCRWDRIDQAFRITKQAGDSFRYSDFGKLQTANFGKYKGVTAENFDEAKTKYRNYEGGELKEGASATWDNIPFSNTDFDMFGGGYKVAELQHRPTSTMNFSGKAVGSVYASDSNTHPDKSVALQDNAATLHFEGGEEQLTMHFNQGDNKYYNVVVTKNDAAGTNNITFSNFAAGGDEYLRFMAEDITGKVDVPNFTTSTATTEGLLDMGYYGLSGPDEATGIVRFKETTTIGSVQYEHEFRAGYALNPVP